MRSTTSPRTYNQVEAPRPYTPGVATERWIFRSQHPCVVGTEAMCAVHLGRLIGTCG